MFDLVDPAMLDGLEWIAREREYTRVRGGRAAALLLRNQFAGLEKAVSAGIEVKVNSVLVPGINDRELTLIAERARALGAGVMNVMPLIPSGEFIDILTDVPYVTSRDEQITWRVEWNGLQPGGTPPAMLRWGSSATAKDGDDISVVSNPLGQLPGTLSRGIISASRVVRAALTRSHIGGSALPAAAIDSHCAGQSRHAHHQAARRQHRHRTPLLEDHCRCR